MQRAGSTTQLAKPNRMPSFLRKPLRPVADTTSSYSTSDVSRILGINQSRVRNWIVKDFILPSWHTAIARGDKNLLTYDDMCSVHLFQQLSSKGFRSNAIAYIIKEIAKTGITHLLKSGFRYVIWNTKNPREGGVAAISRKIPHSMIDASSEMLIVDLLEVKNEVDRKRQKRGG